MRKASRIIYLVAAILSIFAAIGFLISGIVLIVVPNTETFIQAFIDTYNAEATSSSISAAEALEACQAFMIALGVEFIIHGVCAGVNSFLAFKAHHEPRPSKALNVLNIVFSVLGLVEVNIVAAIFAFIADGQEDRRAVEEKK